ncbi:MAG: hypothetical protein WBN34_07270, partial [Woeseia sp.]
MNYWTSLKLAAITATLAVTAGLFLLQPTAETEVRTSYIVQGQSFEAVLDAVSELDAEVTHELRVIRSVAVNLTEGQAKRLLKQAAVGRLFGNQAVEVSGKPSKRTNNTTSADEGTDSTTSVDVSES